MGRSVEIEASDRSSDASQLLGSDTSIVSQSDGEASIESRSA